MDRAFRIYGNLWTILPLGLCRDNSNCNDDQKSLRCAFHIFLPLFTTGRTWTFAAPANLQSTPKPAKTPFFSIDSLGLSAVRQSRLISLLRAHMLLATAAFDYAPVSGEHRRQASLPPSWRGAAVTPSSSNAAMARFSICFMFMPSPSKTETAFPFSAYRRSDAWQVQRARRVDRQAPETAERRPSKFNGGLSTIVPPVSH